MPKCQFIVAQSDRSSIQMLLEALSSSHFLLLWSLSFVEMYRYTIYFVQGLLNVKYEVAVSPRVARPITHPGFAVFELNTGLCPLIFIHPCRE